MNSKLVLIVLFLMTSLGCNNQAPSNDTIQGKAPVPTSSSEQTESKRKLIAVTDYNSISYFIYRGTPMGFHFELLQSLADFLNEELEIVVSNDIQEAIDMLNRGECDLLALNLTVTKERSRLVRFTDPIYQTRQVLVQRTESKTESDVPLIRNQLDLARKSLHLQAGTVFANRLRSLSDEIGDTIYVHELPNYDVESIIKLISEGELDYTVCDESVALVNATYFENIDVATEISFPQNIAWATRESDTKLNDEVNNWLSSFKNSPQYYAVYNKYFRNSRTAKMFSSDFFTLKSGKVSGFDVIFKSQSTILDWDWKLLASLVYQESNFNPTVRSWAGAYGLMQLMPATAERFGIDSLSTPEEHIQAGVKYLVWLQNFWQERVGNKEEQIKFVLASYNAGLGHVLDARRLAEKYGKNPDIWTDHVDYFMLNKSKPVYYKDTLVKYGYCRGEEPYRYVSEIIDRYQHYKNIIQD